MLNLGCRWTVYGPKKSLNGNVSKSTFKLWIILELISLSLSVLSPQDKGAFIWYLLLFVAFNNDSEKNMVGIHVKTPNVCSDSRFGEFLKYLQSCEIVDSSMALSRSSDVESSLDLFVKGQILENMMHLKVTKEY